MVLHGHSCGVVRVWFLVTSFWMLVGFVFSHDESGERGDDRVSDGLDGDKFIMWMTVVDGEMTEFVQIGVLVRGIYLCGMMILDGGICGSLRISCVPSMKLVLFGLLV
ncbi:hypothetical protein EJB05_35102, partial [Eragrostis curvula]